MGILNDETDRLRKENSDLVSEIEELTQYVKQLELAIIDILTNRNDERTLKRLKKVLK